MKESVGLGFKAIAVKCNEKSGVTRWLFVKQHSSREKVPQKPSEKTLFVLNVPPFCDENSLMNTFKCFGEIENVYCHSNPTVHLPPQDKSIFFQITPKIQTYKVSYIVFKSPKGLMKVLSHNSEVPLLLSSQENPIVTGLEKWTNDYNSKVIDPSILQKEIDNFMANFDEEERKKEAEQVKDGEQDEEGWVKVTRKTKKHVVPRTEAARKKILAVANKKRAKKELKNFYTFQIRESKMKQLEALRKKFEEDKNRITAFKQARKFKPF